MAKKPVVKKTEPKEKRIKVTKEQAEAFWMLDADLLDIEMRMDKHNHDRAALWIEIEAGLDHYGDMYYDEKKQEIVLAPRRPKCDC